MPRHFRICPSARLSVCLFPSRSIILIIILTHPRSNLRTMVPNQLNCTQFPSFLATCHVRCIVLLPPLIHPSIHPSLLPSPFFFSSASSPSSICNKHASYAHEKEKRESEHGKPQYTPFAFVFSLWCLLCSYFYPHSSFVAFFKVVFPSFHSSFFSLSLPFSFLPSVLPSFLSLLSLSLSPSFSRLPFPSFSSFLPSFLSLSLPSLSCSILITHFLGESHAWVWRLGFLPVWTRLLLSLVCLLWPPLPVCTFG